MSLIDKSTSTRKASTTREEREAKRRQKFPTVTGYETVPVPALGEGASASIVQSANQGGYFAEYMDSQGFAHAVPVEALAALGWTEPKPSK